jgi:hypothetical protein
MPEVMARSPFVRTLITHEAHFSQHDLIDGCYQNRATQAAQVIEELIEMAKEMRRASERGEKLGLTEEELRC